MSSRRTVHIPIVQPGGAGAGRAEDRLIEVYTQVEAFDPLTRHEQAEAREIDAKARDKDWDRVAAPLRKVALYQAGCAAASAVRKLGIRRPPTALFQQISRLTWIDAQRLHAAGAQGPTEGRSAELGLALVLLMCASGSRERQIIATGALGGQPRGVGEDDVEVLPVASIREKLRIVQTLAGHGALPGMAPGRELLFFTPCRFEEDGHWQDVADLPEVAELARLGVKVVPVARLGEAAAALKAHRARHLLADRLAAALIAGLILLTGFGMAWSAVREQPIPLAFLPGGGGAVEPRPFQVCFTADGGFYPVPLRRDGIGYSIPAGATIGWRVRVGEPEDGRTGLVAWLAPEVYHVAQVMVSESSRAKVMVPQLTGSEPMSVSPGGIWEWGWKLNERAESNGLVLLAQGSGPIDADGLRSRLIERFPRAAEDPPEGGGTDVTAAINFVAGLAPGALKFTLETVEDEAPCEP